MPDDRQTLHDGLRMAAVALGDAGIPYALCGGFAAWARGAPEPSHDVDFVIREEDVGTARKALADAGLELRDPPENWLFKAYHGDALIDVLFRMVGEPPAPEIFARATVLEVLAVRMPVLEATDIFSAKLRVMNEHYCDFGSLLPVARALREQIEWDRVRLEAGDNPFALAFLHLLDLLRITPDGAAGGPATFPP